MNCTVQSFEVGIRLRGATNATVRNSAAEANTRYGLEITGNSTGALIEGNTIAYNGDEGIHVSGPTDRDALHHIAGNTVEGNAREGIYLFDSDANTVADNHVQNHAAAGIYVTRSNRNIIEGNTLLNDPIQLANGSQLNLLRDNTIVGQRIKFDSASHNEVHNMSVTGQGGVPGPAYDFYRSSNNTILDSEAIKPGSYHIKAAASSKNNTFTRLSATPTLRCSVDRTSQVIVTDQNGNRLRCGKSLGKWTSGPAIGDFNGDGVADILWRHTSGALQVWFMRGGGNSSILGSAAVANPDNDWTIRGIGDLNGDGVADVLWQHISGVVAVWLMNGSHVIGTGSLGTISSDWSIQGVGDFNGDGKTDILWRHTSGAVAIWRMNGTSIASMGAPVGVGTEWTIQGVGDFNGDGKADILWRNTSGLVYIWLMNGTSISGVGSPGRGQRLDDPGRG